MEKIWLPENEKIIPATTQDLEELDKIAESKLSDLLKSRKWRINNLYWIIDKQGQMVKFKMNQFQEFIFDNFWYFTVILKARQLGITTFFSILYLDAVLFNKNKTAGILAHTEKDASKIFTNK